MTDAEIITALHDRVRTLTSLVEIVAEMDEDGGNAHRIKVYRSHVPQLFTESDGSALWFVDACRRALKGSDQ
jgi:hypothetical protein